MSYEEKERLKQTTSDLFTRFIRRQHTPKCTINHLVPNIFVFFCHVETEFFLLHSQIIKHLNQKIMSESEKIQDYLLASSTQRAGFAAIITGILSIDCTDAEAVALQVTASNILIDVLERAPVDDEITQALLKAALDFAERGIAREEAVNELKDVLNGGE